MRQHSLVEGIEIAHVDAVLPLVRSRLQR